MRLLPLLALLGALLSILPASAEEPFRFDRTPGRLPKDVVPTAYRIELAPDLAKRSFKGRVDIDLDVRASSPSITLNGADLVVHKARLAVAGHAARAVQAEVKAGEELIVIHPGRPLAPGHYVLSLEYDGKINDSPNGLYADTYQTPAGKRTLLGTQLESTDARRVFPCWRTRSGSTWR